MRHNRDEKRFDMTWSHLRSVLANMTSDMVMNGRIKTTTQRAKVLRRYADKMVTLAKNGTVAARRQAMAFLRNKAAVTHLFDKMAAQYKTRNGGYTRIIKLGTRPGDNAQVSLIEYVGEDGSGAQRVVPEVKAKVAKAPKEAKPKAEKKPKAAAKPKVEKKAKAAPKEAKPKVEKKEGVKKTTKAKKTTKTEK